MARKHEPEAIISKLREAEMVLAQSRTVADVCRRIGITEALVTATDPTKHSRITPHASYTVMSGAMARGRWFALHLQGFASRGYVDGSEEWIVAANFD